jgi:hypothetical protein
MLSIIYFFVGWVSCYYFLSEQRTTKFRNSNFKSLIESSYEKSKENLTSIQKQENVMLQRFDNYDDLIFFVNEDEDEDFDDDDLVLPSYDGYDGYDGYDDEDGLDLDLSFDDDDLVLPSYDDEDGLDLDLSFDDDDLVLPSYDTDEYDNFDLSIEDNLNFLLRDDDPLTLPDFDELEFHFHVPSNSLFIKKPIVKEEEVCWWKEGF